MDYALLLANIGRHIELTKAEQAVFTALLRPRAVRRRQYVVQAGEPCQYETFVVRGCLRAYYVDANGFEHNLMFAVEDWWTGDLLSFLTGAPASLNVEALEDSEVLQLDKSALEQLYAQVPKFERYFRLMIQNAFVAQQQRIVSALSASAEERYHAFRRRYPALEQRLPQRHIASYLGITPEFLSKLRKQVLHDKRKP
ncbi:Crp/Fnr family transcriptional regulator [Hymenobacter sp. BT664]|uniref:Crp/Fnr family transcriptional regulator n=1 Tax=Hymenobacter montanus TaxID=2771359 RepID=A0A927GL71_9BACT|nr:Crp/Fnr family transcriptional regulator [Hymenobacter montanus]MBD2770215.1 Crp/Fnr family transcriptional regulator [Hymenobacter montanus]